MAGSGAKRISLARNWTVRLHPSRSSTVMLLLNPPDGRAVDWPESGKHSRLAAPGWLGSPPQRKYHSPPVALHTPLLLLDDRVSTFQFLPRASLLSAG